jgi:quercetin dioxygenase-like cupin family protein
MRMTTDPAGSEPETPTAALRVGTSEPTLRADTSEAALRAGAFEAALRADGFQEILRREAPAGGDPTPHAHAWDVRGLVLRGTFMVDAAGEVQRCAAGEVFTLAAGRTHIEAAGPEGAELLVGRRHRGEAG